MSSKRHAGPPQEPPKAIDVYQAVERALWAQKLQVSEERLKAAVREVGVEVDAVRRYLSQ
jgi:hypothetical protein